MAVATTTAARTAPKSAPKAAPAKKAVAKTTATKVETTTTKPEDSETPLAYLLDKAPTELHTNYRTWLQEQLGTELTERDLKMIQIVCVSRMDFQRSEANQGHLTTRKQAWAKAQEAKKAQQAEAKKARLAKLAAELGVEIKSA